jgi:D-alanyl-D-alanine carboxypeptidase
MKLRLGWIGRLACPLLMVAVVVAGSARGISASPASRQVALDGIVADGVAAGLPGVVLAAQRTGDDEIVSVAGVSSRERGTPLAATDRFRIYSLTKTFTAVVVLQLIEEGRLSLDQPVLAALPAAAETGIPYLDAITVRQLLDHTSGIYDYADETDSPFYVDAFFGENADWSKVWTPWELLAYADGARHAPYFAPGEGNHYSNTNYILLGLIVEEITGNAFGDELQTRIFEPLGLTATSLPVGAELPADLVDGYHVIDGQEVNVSALNTSWVWAAGGIVSTASDVLHFADALFAGSLLGPAMQREMMPAATDDPEGSVGLGLFGGETAYGPAIANDGGSAGFLSQLMYYPEPGVIIVAVTNIFPADGAPFAKVIDDATTVMMEE